MTRPLLFHAYLFFGVLEAVYSLALFFLVLWLGGWRYGEPLAAAGPLYRSATGITLASVILLQIANLIGRRSVNHSGLDRGVIRNPLIVLGIAIEIVFVTALLYWKPLQNVLGTGPVPLFVFGLAWLGVPLIFGCDYAAKRWLRRHRAPQISKST